ncbi:hypothetical protein ACP70R_022048 [Stipagrostis hirtigluma subsp. patula]
MASASDPPQDPASDPKPRKYRGAEVPAGLNIPMCLCGDICILREARDCAYYFGRRFFMCANYDHEPTPRKYQGDGRPSPPPLCEFFQWLDLEQTSKKRAEVYSIHREAVQDFLREEQWEREKQEFIERKRKEAEARRQYAEEQRLRREEAERRAAADREAERERKRERARRAREAGPDAQRKGKWPRCTQ